MKRNFAIVFTCALFAVLSCFGVSAATSENATNEMTIEQLTNLYVVSAPDFFEVFLEQKTLANDFGMEKVSGIEGGYYIKHIQQYPLGLLSIYLHDRVND